MRRWTLYPGHTTQRTIVAVLAAMLLLASRTASLSADESRADSTDTTLAPPIMVRAGTRDFEIPAGYSLELVSAPELVQRPIVADLDDRGRLYVADSSGSNDDVQTQLRTLPHRIVRLDDEDGDGRFDTSTVFADKMMFPEGVLWHAGSVFVSAPPVIWKLTDTDGDGVCDRRETWFDGRTLTGCTNDLHGPYLGPDGWIYWCKGAFAEQTYDRGGRPTTRSKWRFRRKASDFSRRRSSSIPAGAGATDWCMRSTAASTENSTPSSTAIRAPAR